MIRAMCAVVAGVVLLGSSAEAIKWDFDDGTTQGWIERKPRCWAS